MANKLSQHLQNKSENPNKKVSNATILNTIREMASESYRADIPQMGDMQAINHSNVPYTQYAIHENEFFNILINRIGSVLFKALLFENPLGVFRSDSFEYGETAQEIYVGLAEDEGFNPKDNNSPFKHRDTDIMIFYHDLKRESKYVRTIEKAWSAKAFISDNSFDEFIDKMFVSLLTSDSLDEYEAIKELIPKSLTPVLLPDGRTVTTPATYIDMTSTNWVENFNKELIKRSRLFSTPSRTRFENGAGVPSATPLDGQYLMVTADFSSELDTLLANAYNMDKATVLAKKIVVDEFPQYTGAGTHNGAKPIAVLLSENTIILKDKLLQMNNIFNPNTLSYNYFLHHHQLISYSLVENAHVYYTM